MLYDFKCEKCGNQETLQASPNEKNFDWVMDNVKCNCGGKMNRMWGTPYIKPSPLYEQTPLSAQKELVGDPKDADPNKWSHK